MIDDACLLEYWDYELRYGAELRYDGSEADYEEYHDAVIKLNSLGNVCWHIDTVNEWEHASSVQALFARFGEELLVRDWKLCLAPLPNGNTRQLRLFDSRGRILCNRI
jgi:hypothetical protein